MCERRSKPNTSDRSMWRRAGRGARRGVSRLSSKCCQATRIVPPDLFRSTFCVPLFFPDRRTGEKKKSNESAGGLGGVFPGVVAGSSPGARRVGVRLGT